MSRSNYNHLAESAFRIYLTHVHCDMENLLVEYKLRLDISFSPKEINSWQSIVEAAIKVVDSIRRCQTEDWLIHEIDTLCLVEAAQDALACALGTARMHNFGCWSSCHHYELLTKDHFLRWTCIENAMTFRTTDPQLASLWDETAISVYQQSQLRRVESQGKCWSQNAFPVLQTKDTLSKCSTPETVPLDPVESELLGLAVRNRHLAMIHDILNRRTDYQFAKDTYESARSFYERSIAPNQPAAKLWHRAYSSMRQAAEMIEAQAPHNTASHDVVIKETIQLAQEFADDAAQVLAHLSELDKLKAQLLRTQGLMTQHKVPAVLSAWRLLAEVQEKSLHLWKRYVEMYQNGESRSAVAVEVLAEYRVVNGTLTSLTAVAEKMERNVKTAEYNRFKAVQGHHIASAKMRSLWQDCYSRATEFAEKAVTLCAGIINDNLYSPLSPSTQGELHSHGLHAQMYASCASHVLSTAVTYYNSARGARGVTRNAREAQWWTAAADRQLQVAFDYYAKLRSIHKDILLDIIVGQLISTFSVPQRDETSVYATAADYLNRAYTFRTQLHQPSYAKRVAELYTLAAELNILDMRYRTTKIHTFGLASKFALKLIDFLAGAKDFAFPGHVAVLERGCQYALYLSCAFDACPIISSKWSKAFHCCHQAYLFLENSCRDENAKKKANIELARAALFALSAEAYTQGYERQSIACSLAAEVLGSTTEVSRFSQALTNYSAALAQRIYSTYAESVDVPDELLALQSLQLDQRLARILNDHVVAFGQTVECYFQCFEVPSDSTDGKIWNEAKQIAKNLSTDYITQVKHICALESNGVVQTRLADESALRKVTLDCFVAAARSGSDVWDEALCACRETEGRSRVLEGTAVVKRYMLAAEARLRNDGELAELMTAAAVAARKAMLRIANDADLLAHRALVGEADQRVLVLLAARDGQTEITQSYWAAVS